VDRDRHGERAASRRHRALRGSVAAVVATLVAATAHTLAGGGAPPWWMLLSLALLTSPVAVWLIGRRPTIRGTAAAVVAAQLALHVAFAAVGAGDPASASPTDAAPGHSAGHSGSSAAAAALGRSLAAAGHLHLDAGMILAHIVAALVTVLLLTHGERLVRAIAGGIRRVLSRARPVLPPPAVPVPRFDGPLAVVAAVFLSALSRRGPPALAR
jgi:hypothetical protein